MAKHGEGTYVADIIGMVFAPSIVDLIGTNQNAKADYLEYRREVEGLTASLAAQRATEADKVILTGLMTAMEDAHEKCDPVNEADLDVEFHTAIGECAHNIILLHTLRSCYRLLSDDVFFNRHLIYSGQGMREKLLEQHRTILNAVLDGHPEAAAKAANDHISFVEKATNEVEHKDDRSNISALRLAQRQWGE